MKWIAAVAVALLLCGCDDDGVNKPKYGLGQMVKSKLSGQKGQVIFVDCFGTCRYYVRFATVSIVTQTHTLDPDGPIRIEPFSTVRLNDFELEPAD